MPWPDGADSPRDLRGSLRGAQHVLFLCSGNMVRSPFAELCARHLGLGRPVSSAATRFRNEGLYPETRAALRERGVPEEWIRAFRSRHLEDVWPSLPPRTLVLGMTRSHLAGLAETGLDPARAFLLGTALPGTPEIPDPVLDGADFSLTFARLEACVRALIDGP